MAVFLLPRTIHVPGWSHQWAGTLQTSCETIPEWPSKLRKLRGVTKFLRVDAYRETWADAVRAQGGDPAVANEIMKPYRGSFLH